MKRTLIEMGVGFAVPVVCGGLLIIGATTAMAQEELSPRDVVMGMTQEQGQAVVTPKAYSVSVTSR